MSKVYTPHRIQGLVSGDVTAVLQTRGTQHFVTTCLEKSFHTYNCDKLTLKFVSPLHDSNITSLTTHKDLIFTAADSSLFSWSRGKLVRSYPGHTSNISHLLPFGDKIISFGEDKKMIVHDIETGEVYGEVSFNSCTTAVTHPATYLNKILIGNKDGCLELWNVRTLKVVHQFKPFDSQITVLTQTPGLDIIGVGLNNGKVLLHNIKLDETVLTFYQDWGCVTSLSFRSDGIPHMVTGSTEGHLAIWDLDKGELHSTVHNAHHSTVHTAVFLASQPLLLTSSPDNSLKIWVFDGPGGTSRLLKERSGHRAPPTIARFYGADSVLSAGYDRSVRLSSVVKDERSKELSQGSILSKSKKMNINMDDLKLSPVTAIAAEEIREREWSNVITAHSGSRDVRMWNTVNGTLTNKPLSPKLESIVVTAVAMTVCGNIGVVGYNSGHLTAYNLQSGINRGLYGKPFAHRGKITGVCTDSINKYVISVGEDMNVKIWELSEGSLVTSLSLLHPITRSTLHRDSNLLACALQDGTVCLVDIDTYKTVREFRHSASVVDVCYSVDGKFILVATGDHVIRLWDLVTARLVDCFKTANLVTSVSLSKENLVTTSSNELGICIWTNNTLYEDIELKPLPEDYEPRLIEMGDAPIPTDMETDDSPEEDWKSSEQINEFLITLSSTPKAKWTVLCNLDVIKKRNKPKAPPSAPKAVPFFMTTTKELVPKFVLEDISGPEEEKMKNMRNEESDFQRVITSTSDPKEILRYLDTVAPSALDIELQSLAPMDGGTHELVCSFLDFLIGAIKMKVDFDLVQAYLNMFLKHNREYLMKTGQLHDQLAELKTLQSSSWSELQQRIQECLCVTNFLKSATL